MMESVSMMDFSKVLDHIGHFGKFQLYVYTLACIPQLFVGIHMLANVFLLGEPDHRCFVDGCDSSHFTTFNEPWLNFTLPKVKDVNTGQLVHSQCDVFAHNHSIPSCDPEYFNDSSAVPCSKFVYDTKYYKSTGVSQWNVVCADKWKLPLANSLFMCGILVGALVCGYVADKYGRKTVFIFVPVLFLGCAVGTAFSPSFEVFLILRFFTALCVSGLFQTAFVVAIEFVGSSYRLWCANIMQIIFAIGELLLAAVAYFVRDWKYIQIIISVPLAVLLLYVWLMPESVRWQLSHGQTEEAVRTMRKAASWNKKDLPQFLLDDYLVQDEDADDSLEESVSAKKQKASVLDLVRHPLLRRWSPNIFFNWFVNSLVYYGLSMQAGQLGGDPYTNFVALSAVEIPAVFLSTFALAKCGRRITLCVALLVGGVACIIPATLPKTYHWLSIPLAVFGKSNIAASFAIIYIYSAEVFPTVVRSTAIGVASTGARIGGIIAPTVGELAYLGEEVPMIIFGVFAVVAGLLSFDLPETRNKILPEEIDDVALLKRKTMKNDYLPVPSNRKSSTGVLTD